MALLGSSNRRPLVNPTSITSPSENMQISPSQGAYTSAVSQQAGDYDKLMERYGDLYGQAQNNRMNIQNKGAYTRTNDFTSAINKAKGFANTGGYSSGDITAFRERGLAPIRSIYNTALNNLKRQRALQGGYSPNFGALQAKLAREQSGQVGQQTMDLNANIAERVNEGQRFGIQQFGNMATNDQQMVNDANRMKNMDLSNSIGQALQANNAAANLYGTTPALVNTFGNQVLQSNAQKLSGQQAEANIRQNRAETGVNLLGMNASYRPRTNYGLV